MSSAVKGRLPAPRTGVPAAAELIERRKGMEAAVAAGMWRAYPPPAERYTGGVRCLWFHPPGASRATLLHLHGGAFRIGSPEQVAPFARALSTRCGVTVVCPAYRLAPEHPFPAALSDGWAVLKVLPKEAPIFVSGDSAGGALAAGLAQIAAAAGLSMAGLILLSPWLDLTMTSQSFETNAPTDQLFSFAAAQEAAQLYLQGHAPEDPLASPLLAAPAGFPPSFISAGTGEVLAGDARHLHELLHRADVPATLSLVDGMEHVAVTRDFRLTGAEETFAEICEFVLSVLSADGT